MITRKELKELIAQYVEDIFSGLRNDSTSREGFTDSTQSDWLHDGDQLVIKYRYYVSGKYRWEDSCGEFLRLDYAVELYYAAYYDAAETDEPTYTLTESEMARINKEDYNFIWG